jgi:hypothetical protein
LVVFPNVFHHDFKLCFVGGDVALVETGTGAGCGLAKGCCELDEAAMSEAMANAIYMDLQVANIKEYLVCPATALGDGPAGPGEVDGGSQLSIWAVRLGTDLN